jgi:hypothetical protein
LTQPLLAQLLLNTAPYWLMENYFRVRQLPFRGERWALTYWREHEPDLILTLDALYRADDLEVKFGLVETLTELVLAPVGGAWQSGEILAFGAEVEEEPLAARAAATYRWLFGG